MNLGQVHLAVHQNPEFFADGRFDDQAGHYVLILPHGPERLDRGARLGLPAAVIATAGILELLFAMMIFFGRWRRLAALGQMALLVVFLPSPVYMMINDSAIAMLFGHLTDYRWVRFLTVLHNVVLSLWALWVLEPDGSVALIWPRLEISSRVLLVPMILLLANAAGFGVIVAGPWQASTPSLWAMACLAVGALIGFIFGVPRVERPANIGDSIKAAGLRYVPNANIEALSDWLTKIIIGVGLVEIGRISDFVGKAARYMSTGLIPRIASPRVTSDPTAFAAGIIVFFFVAGVIEGYLLTRMYLGRAFQADDVVR